MPIEHLLERLEHVRATELSPHAARFRQLADEGQHPSVLFVSCSDSRILPSLLVGAGPGELFMVRTVGNIVAPLDTGNAADPTAAAVEFAVGVLGVDDIVVCGHTQCGAMSALYDGAPAELEHLVRWIEHARPAALDEAQAATLTKRERDRVTSERNVLLSLDRLAADPLVRERRTAGLLRMHGWILDLKTQEVEVFDPATTSFRKPAI